MPEVGLPGGTWRNEISTQDTQLKFKFQIDNKSFRI